MLWLAENTTNTIDPRARHSQTVGMVFWLMKKEHHTPSRPVRTPHTLSLAPGRLPDLRYGWCVGRQVS